MLRFALFFAGVLALTLFTFADHFGSNPDDPLVGYVLTDRNDKALAEINRRLEKPNPGDERDELLMQKVSVELKDFNPEAALEALKQITPARQSDPEYQHKAWRVYWAVLENLSPHNSKFKEYNRISNEALSKTLNVPTFISESMIESARKYLKAFPDAALTQKVDHLKAPTKRKLGPMSGGE